MTRARAHPDAMPSVPLLTRARDGDPSALAELLEPYRDGVYRLALRVSGNPADAEDLAQEAFLKIIRHLSSYRGECAFRSWIYRTTLNVCLTARARPRPDGFDLPETPLTDPSPGPETLALQHEFRRRIRTEIERLPGSYRDAVLLRLTEELTYAEIAEALGVPLNTALTRVHRGMKRLRDRMEPWLKGESLP